jgi:hypothetical protein
MLHSSCDRLIGTQRCGCDLNLNWRLARAFLLESRGLHLFQMRMQLRTGFIQEPLARPQEGADTISRNVSETIVVVRASK